MQHNLGECEGLKGWREKPTCELFWGKPNVQFEEMGNRAPLEGELARDQIGLNASIPRGQSPDGERRSEEKPGVLGSYSGNGS